MNFVEACRKLISIDSSPQQGSMEIAKFAVELCQEAGLHVDLHEEVLNGTLHCNLVARPTAGRPEEEFMMQSHLDTVSPGDFSLWTETTNNPFDGSIHGDKIYGLGAADAKLDFLCKVQAAAKFKGRNLSKMPFVLVGTFGAENGMGGAIKLIRRKLVNVKKALIGKPTSLKICHAGLGVATVEISVPFSAEEKEYQLSHDLRESASSQSKIFVSKDMNSPNPRHSENAIVKMFDYLESLPSGFVVLDIEGGSTFDSVPPSAVLELDAVDALRDPIIPKISKINNALKKFLVDFQTHVNEDYNPPYPSLRIGKVETKKEVVRLTGTCRVPPSVQEVVYQEWIEKLRESCQEVGSTFSILDYKLPFMTAEDSFLAQACKQQMRALGASEELQKMSASTEASIFGRMGMDCIVFGPGEGIGNSQAPNEHVNFRELETAQKFYEGVIERICV